MESDSASTEDLIAYNIIPIDATTSTNAIVFFPEVLELSLFKTFFFLPVLWRHLTRKNLLLGASSSFSSQIFQWLAWTAQGLFHFSHKECQHVRFSAVYFWISGLYMWVFYLVSVVKSRLVLFFQLSYCFCVLELSILYLFSNMQWNQIVVFFKIYSPYTQILVLAEQ